PPPPRGAVSGLVVAADPLPAGGVGRVKAVRVADPAKLAALDAFFPDYARRPRGNTAAGWIAGHHVYFDLPGGDTVRVAVSANDEGATWSAGQGDFDSRGDFKAFVAALPK
ncbi:MAG TPA: hypothetical protein VER17_04955, partial [Tepidisphaeraceae bacterium]|nr:hypothetical protein [Tepidisphaeraceae bacterium]